MSKDIDEMVATVKNEIKDTLGLPRPHRKVQPVKEAQKRIEKLTKSTKHEITEQFARENMSQTYFNQKRNTLAPGKIEVNELVDAKYHKGIRLESIFDPRETKKLQDQALEKALGSNKKKMKPVFD